MRNEVSPCRIKIKRELLPRLGEGWEGERHDVERMRYPISFAKLKAKKYAYSFLFHPFFDAKNGWSLRNMPTCCSAHTDLENNYGLLKQMRLIVV